MPDDRDLLAFDQRYQQYITERQQLEIRYFHDKFKAFPKNRYWYLATPYDKYPHGHDQAWVDACRMAALCWDNGIRVFCPIAGSHSVVPHIDPDMNTHERWMEYDYMFLDNAVGLIVTMMDGWRESRGIDLEIKYAGLYGKPIVYTDFMEVPRIG